jgi:lysozyme
MDRDVLTAELIRDEGVRLKPYRDTVGKLTIGVGRNLDDVGITLAEAMVLLGHDITWAVHELETALPWFKDLDPVRQRVLCNMCFNLGLARLLGFRNTLAAVARGDYTQAAIEMMDSKWATQVGDRAKRLAKMMEQG